MRYIQSIFLTLWIFSFHALIYRFQEINYVCMHKIIHAEQLMQNGLRARGSRARHVWFLKSVKMYSLSIGLMKGVNTGVNK